jgi:hypothetical protein
VRMGAWAIPLHRPGASLDHIDFVRVALDDVFEVAPD